MAVPSIRAAEKSLTPVADVPVSYDFPLFDVKEVEVTYGRAGNTAILNADYDVTLASDYMSFTVTPRQSLRDKLDALILADASEEDAIVVRRTQSPLTPASEENIRLGNFLLRTVERLHMMVCEVREIAQRSYKRQNGDVGTGPTEVFVEKPEPDTVVVFDGQGRNMKSGPLVSVILDAQTIAAEAAAEAQQAKEQTEELRNETSGLKDDVTQLKSDVTQLKSDTQTIYDDTVIAKNAAEDAAQAAINAAASIETPDASEVDYSNAISGLAATNVQDAIDEVVSGLGSMAAEDAAEYTKTDDLGDLALKDKVAAADVDSETAPAGRVLTSDGLGGAAWGPLSGGGGHPVIEGFLVSKNQGTQRAIGITAGTAFDSTRTQFMSGAAMTKAMGSAWAAGSGNGSNDGSNTNGGLAYVFAIYKDSDGSVDYLTSSSRTAPTLPSGYTKFRRIGVVYDNASLDYGTAFLLPGGASMTIYDTPYLDIDVTNQGTTDVTYNMSVPGLGGAVDEWVGTIAMLHGTVGNAIVVGGVNAQPAMVPSATGLMMNYNQVASRYSATGLQRIPTGGGRALRIRSTAASTTVKGTTLGFVDYRFS